MHATQLKTCRPNPGRFLLFCLLVILASAPRLLAQGEGDRSSYNRAVDQINCETIRFIHREAGRAEVANNLDCSTYEAISASIPEDEASTTAKVAKEIEAYKSKFQEGKPLAEQIDAVIKYAAGRITSKKRKQNVEDYKTLLETYKQEALNGAAGAAPAPAAGGTATTPTGEEQPAAAEPAPEATASKGGGGWMTNLSLLFALAALGLSAFLFTRLRALQSAVAGASSNAGGSSSTDAQAIRRAQLTAEEVSQQYRRLENKMHEELNKLNSNVENKLSAVDQKLSEVDEKIALATASTGYTLPEAMTEREVSKPAFTSPVEEKTPTPPPAMPVEEAAEPVYHQLDINEDGDTMMTEEEEESWSSEDIVEEEEAPEDEINTTIPQRPIADDMAGRQAPLAAQQAPVIPHEETEHVGEGMPYYLYAGEPSGDGFPQSMLKDAPSEDSLYEIELYEDVPDKAFFSLLPYPEVIKKALSDPDRYLAPCFTYSEDPAGRRTIVLVEEGMLRRQGDRWVVYEKARIKFE